MHLSDFLFYSKSVWIRKYKREIHEYFGNVFMFKIMLLNHVKETQYQTVHVYYPHYLRVTEKKTKENQVATFPFTIPPSES